MSNGANSQVIKPGDPRMANVRSLSGASVVRRYEGELAETVAKLAAAEAKIANQAKRIRYFEGATNHATGTPLSRARSCLVSARALANTVIESASNPMACFYAHKLLEQISDALGETDPRQIATSAEESQAVALDIPPGCALSRYVDELRSERDKAREALVKIRDSAGFPVMVCTEEGHSFCAHTANAALAAS